MKAKINPTGGIMKIDVDIKKIDGLLKTETNLVLKFKKSAMTGKPLWNNPSRPNPEPETEIGTTIGGDISTDGKIGC